MAPTANSALQARVDALGETVREGFDELKELLRGIDARVRTVETQSASVQPLVNQRLAQLEATALEHGGAIKALEKITAQLASTNGILKWILGIITAVLTAFLIALVTGKLQLLFA